MKIATFEIEGQARTGALTADGALLDLAAASGAARAPLFATMLSIIENEEAALDVAAGLLAADRGDHLHALDAVRLLAPLPVPNSIRDFANFELHTLQALEASMRTRAASQPDPEAAYASYKASGAYNLPPIWYERPFYFKGNRMTCSGHGATIRWPRFTNTMDYEVECAAIIGRRGVDIAVEDARAHIFGYTIYNDFSARDEQVRDQQFRMGPSKGKDFDTGNAFGPWIVTRDEFSDPGSAKMESRINGDVQGRGRLGDMQHSFEQIIAFVSRDETLYPGDVLGSGTMGNGCGFETGRYLEPGDVIELTVEGIGTLTNIIGEKRC
ncbi:fumarylacetoacetate hydrolase family protein [Sphingosinicella soli]|uniref:2-keto-4-pentenoate hydratase/2-oxohepta-3-ene-1,7-dioic acid hydratase in catechol pathway n=1 Tax=Sphingosinicella soli TaxID=333708 RepID=A0A7W7AZ69_9SPHN|nr:fumarylacetoacetate hydrolase family protein [Sphingosinicella soli]MBB4631074.1 2-keto-4-pentenoate hydratase/2-oxohepta-3-ene-1,7-dioic acid hydratase in catechol pathway [Sphingosinicella soli]